MRALVLILILVLATLAHGCTVSTQIAARRMVTDDGVVTATIYAGHRFRSLPLRLAWQNTSTAVVGTIILPPHHTLLLDDIPSDWYDGESALTLEKLFFASRSQQRLWAVSTGDTPSPAAGVLYLGPTSPLWFSHDAVVFSGSMLHFIQRRPGVLCSAADALAEVTEHSAQSSRHYSVQVDGASTHTISVYDGTLGTLQGSWNVTLVWAVDDAQSQLPTDAAALLGEADDYLLMLDDRVLVASGKDIRDGVLVATEKPDFSDLIISSAGHSKRSIASTLPARFTLSRRLLQRIAVSWAVDGAGVVSILFISSHRANLATASTSASGIDSVPSAVYWVQMIIGVALIYLAAFWMTHLGSTLHLSYTPAPGAGPQGVVTTRRDLGYGALVLALSIIAHILLAVYGAHGVLADASLESPLFTYNVAFLVGSLFLGVAFFGVWALDVLREFRVFAGSRHYRFVSVQLYAILMGSCSARGVGAALLLGAGSTLPQLAVTILTTLVMIVFPLVYASLMLLVHLLSDQRLFLPPVTRPPKRPPCVNAEVLARGLEFFACLLVVALTVLSAATFPTYLVTPFLDLQNSYYDSSLILTVTLSAMAVPFLAASFAITERSKANLELACRAYEKAAVAL